MDQPVKIDGLRCQICHRVWVPRDMSKPPRRCPNRRCQSMQWDADRYPTIKMGRFERRILAIA